MPLPAPDTRPVVIIDNYDSFSFNLFQMVQVLTERPVQVYRNDALDFGALCALRPDRVILSPGPGHPGNPSDFGLCADVIRHQDALDCPVLGVCLGHQGLAHHLGGKVISAPEIVHGESSRIRILGDSPLLAGLPDPFEAMRYHSLLVDEACLPPDLEITAREESLNLPMALQHRSRPLYGVQFHPESIGTPQGTRILQNFLERCG